MKKNNIVLITVAVLLIILIGAFMFFKDKEEGSANTNQSDGLASVSQALPGNELKIEDLVVGTGKEAIAGSQIAVHYTGTLLDGTKFDSSVDRGVPFEFTLGVGQVIKGWDQGVQGMKEGGKRKLTIPSDLAYGDNGIPPVIPPKSVLVFEVELLKVN